MATLQYVVNAIDGASGTFSRIALSADKLNAQLADLSKRVATPAIDLQDKNAAIGIADASVKLDRLSAKVAKPDVSVQGLRVAELGILRLDSQLDKLGAKQVKVNVGGIQGLLNKLPGIGGISGGGAAGAASGGGQAASGGLGAVFSNPYTGTAAVVAGLAALPFAAQAAATGIVAALGGGLSAVAILGAAKTKSVKDSFAGLEKTANTDLVQIGKPFVPVLNNILNGAQKLVNQMTPVFTSAEKTIAGPFNAFGTGLEKAFGSPAVKSSITAVGTAFAGILKALTPTLAGDVGDIANGIKNMAQAVAKNPGAFASFVSDLFKIAGGALDIISSLTRVATWIEAHWNIIKWIVTPVSSAIGLVIKYWDTLRSDTAISFNILKDTIAVIFDKILLGIENFALGVTTTMGHLPGPLGAPFRSASADIRKSLATIQQNVRNAEGAIQGDWNRLHGKVVNFGFQFQVPGSVSGHKAVPGFAAGTGGAMPGWAWIGERGPELVRMLGGERVLSHPASVRASRGYALGTEFTDSFTPSVSKFLSEFNTAFAATSAGMVNALGSMASASGGGARGPFAGGGPGGGAPSANAALARQLFPQWASGANWAAWNFVAMAESGWNQFARNPSSGAYGIPQALPPTKMPFAAQAAGGSNPAAQIGWMAGYMNASYGGPQGAANHEANFHWYDRGGWLPTGPSLAYNGTGRPEPVGAARGGNTYNINVHVPPTANKADTGRAVVEAIREFEKRSGSGWRR